MKTCPTPEKRAFPTRGKALRAFIGGALGWRTYQCRCGNWHTTSSVRHHLKRVAR